MIKVLFNCIKHLPVWVSICLILLIAPNIAHAEIPKFQFTHINQNQGLIHNSVGTIYQDHLGYLWIGTENGLDRYDGTRFKHYQHNPNDPRTLLDNAIGNICEDSTGTIWVATHWRGLNRYDRKTDTFSPVQDPALLDATGKYIYIDFIHEGHNQQLWLSSNQGLLQYDIKTQKFTQHRPSNDFTRLSDLAEDIQGNIWLAANEQLWIKDAQDHFTAYPLPTDKETAGTPINRILIDKKGRLFVGGPKGLFIIDTINRQLITYYPNDSLDTYKVSSLLLYNEDTLLISTSTGLTVLDLPTGSLLRYQHNPKDPLSLSTNLISSLYLDKGGALWIGSNVTGLDKSSPYEHKFNLYQYNPFNENSLSGNYIRGMCQDAQGRIWITTQFDGLNQLDRSTGIIKHYHHTNAPGSLISDNLYAVYEDHSQTLWVGTSSQGLQQFNPQTELFVNFPLIPKLSVYVIMEDSRYNLWVGTSNGLYVVSPDRHQVIQHFFRELEINKNFVEIQTLFEDHLGNIWVGINGGLAEITPDFKTITKYSQDIGLSENTYVCSFLEDQYKDLWFTTKKAGIYHYSRSKNKFNHIQEQDGLPSNNTYGIYQDSNKQFWISSDAGIIKYDAQMQQFKAYGIAHGLQSLEFNRRAFLQINTGEIFFGGTNGLNSFNPESIKDNPYIPPVVITGLTINDKPSLANSPIKLSYEQNNLIIEFAALDLSSPEQRQYSYMLEGVEKVWQKASQSQVHYTNLPPGHYVFHVKGSNSDGIWNDMDTTLEFRILPPWWRAPWAYLVYGLLFSTIAFSAFWFQSYRINNVAKLREAFLQANAAKMEKDLATARTAAAEVQACAMEKENRQRAENEAAMRLKTLELESAYTKIEEAYSQIKAAEAELRLKNLDLAEVNLKLKEVDQLKSNFTAMLVHDLKSPLATVTGALELIRMDQSMQKSTALPFIDASEKSIQKILSLVNEVLEVYRAESQEMKLNCQVVKTAEILQEYIESARLAAVKKGITTESIILANLPMINIDVAKMDRVFSNLLANAIKFTPAGGRIILNAQTKEGEGVEAGLTMLVVSITDTGEGIPAEDIPYLFEPYRQAKSNQEKAGVGLGLSIVKRIVAAHGGNIFVRSQLGVGSTFTLTLPVLTNTELTELPVLAKLPSSLSANNNLNTNKHKTRILLAEDDSANQIVTKAYLKKLGYRADIAANGQQVLEKVAEQHYDLIFMDLHMPKLGGLETTQALRQNPQTQAIPIIALTGDSRPQDHEKCFAVGMNDLLAKPYKIGDLQKILAKWLVSGESETNR